MTEILKTVLSLSLSGSLLILLLFLLRPVIKERLSKRGPSRRQSWRLQPDSRPPWPVFLQRNTKLTDPKSCITNKENP